ncbi:MAG: pilus assembly protein TadG-related protein [Thermanaerothrix sp.]|uniref:pilus assembly protein TadG-related protein n=1 Tax=Thermanaerothrix sp. TaxID=2972675 RepID=UPI003C7CBC94
MNTFVSQTRRSERGQIIILLALALVGLLVVAALATDGAQIYTHRRYVQNVADAASLSGGGAALNFMELRSGNNRNVTYDTFSCSSPKVQQAMAIALNQAVAQAAALGYSGLETNNPATRHGVVVTCNSQPYNKYLRVKVVLTSQVNTSFLRLIGIDQLTTTNVAETEIWPRHNIGWGNAIVSLKETCGQNNGGVFIDGTSEIDIEQGGIHSNSCLEANGTVDVEVSGGGITLYDSAARIVGNASLNPTPLGSQPRLTVDLPNITCPTGSAQSVSVSNNDNVTLNPGNYSQIKMTGGTLSFNPGLYCLSGDFEVNGGTVEGYGVTFYLKSGGVRINGKAVVKLMAPNAYDNDEGYNGLLIYLPPENTSEVIIVGNSDSLFSGTILAPASSVEIGGTATTGTLTDCRKTDLTNCDAVTFATQVIGGFVKTHGNAPTEIVYDENANASVAGRMSLIK